MKNKQTIENLRKMKTSELIRERDELKVSLVCKVAKLSESGQKNSPEVKLIRRNIARFETLIFEKLDETVNAKRIEND